jgi:predicted nucleic acid-binding Zn ribbon protein
MGEALQKFLAQTGMAGTLRQFDALTQWDMIVGEQIARVTRAERIEHGVLIVAVATAPWRAELTLRRREILRRINEAIGGRVVRDIQFR